MALINELACSQISVRIICAVDFSISPFLSFIGRLLLDMVIDKGFECLVEGSMIDTLMIKC